MDKDLEFFAEGAVMLGGLESAIIGIVEEFGTVLVFFILKVK